MKILVIGASGMLARPVIKQMNKNGFDLRLFSRNVHESMFYNDHEIYQGDVFNVTDLRNAILDIAKRKEINLISYVSGCTILFSGQPGFLSHFH